MMINKFNKQALILIIAMFAIITLSAQIVNPVKWNFKLNDLPNDEMEIEMTATIDKDWHLYSQKESPNGPLPLYFEFMADSANYSLIGAVEEATAFTTKYDETFETDVYYFEHQAIFKQKIKILTDQPFTITGILDGQACIGGRCVQISEDIVVNIDGKDAVVAVETEIVEENSTEDGSLWGFFWIAFGFGLLAILTPCVFPMIPMTVSFFMHSDSKAQGRFQAIVFGISIILIYTLIGTLLAVFLGPGFANFLSTHWLPNILFFVIFLFFALWFFGAFEITISGKLIGKVDSKADKGGVLGSFFMAFTLVLVSFSCTGPIVGAILVESAGGQILKPIIGMLGYSLAFALPFTLFAFFPSWLSGMPKSGGWLNAVKVTLGFVELALGLKFLSIADQTYHWGILDREVYLALWIVIFSLLGIYLLGKIKFKNDSDVSHVGPVRLILSIITFSFVVYMIPGMWGAPLSALSGYMPPQTSMDFDMQRIVRENAPTQVVSSTTGNSQSLCEEPKFSDFLHLPHGIEGYFDYNQALACAKAQNKPLFIDFTGHGCVNCREMETRVWSNPEVLQRLKNDFIVVALYVDDKTKLPKEDWITSEYDGKEKKTIGKKNADRQISIYNVNAQPYYILMGPDEQQLVPAHAYDLDVNNFIKFLDAGLEAFKNAQPTETPTLAEPISL
ncbi:MAG: cytochrome c biogenesis protein CcdA [Bacteroidales bacterium]|nr:cytochrome c biogenesis protein CcdA [Bacteroidales bacterium]